MKLIINADDFGLTARVSRSIIELLKAGAISDTTAMICIEGAFEQCASLRNTPLVNRVGAHLQTTPEGQGSKPLSPACEISTLVDVDGHFKPKDHGEWINPEEIELEWERQILRVADALGQMPNHLDSHHGQHRIPELIPVYLKLAKKYSLPVRGGKELGLIDGKTLGVASTTLCSTAWTGENNTGIDKLKQDILEKMPLVGNGVLEICAHPGFCDETLIKASSWNTVREKDHAVLLKLAKEGWLKAQGIALINFSDLK